LLNVTPLSYTQVTNSTTGCRPCQVILAVKFTTASTVSSSAPGEWFSRMPQQRYHGLYLLW
jgi:hypothetical protein